MDSHEIRLSEDVEKRLTFQEYGSDSSTIDDVQIVPLRKHRAENGWFTELLRLDEGRVETAASPFDLRQLSSAYATPHRINAFHLHPKVRQDEIWTVLQGDLTIWLVDCRRDSATQGNRRKVHLSAEEPAQLHIPAGVAHGYRAGPSGALLVYAMNQQFSLSDPNEGRLPWDHFGAEIWEEDRG